MLLTLTQSKCTVSPMSWAVAKIYKFSGTQWILNSGLSVWNLSVLLQRWSFPSSSLFALLWKTITSYSKIKSKAQFKYIWVQRLLYWCISIVNLKKKAKKENNVASKVTLHLKWTYTGTPGSFWVCSQESFKQGTPPPSCIHTFHGWPPALPLSR